VDGAGAGLGPHSFEWADEEDFPREMHHYASETFGRAVHDSPHETDEAYPEDEDYGENASSDFEPAASAPWFF